MLALYPDTFHRLKNKVEVPAAHVSVPEFAICEEMRVLRLYSSARQARTAGIAHFAYRKARVSTLMEKATWFWALKQGQVKDIFKVFKTLFR